MNGTVDFIIGEDLFDELSDCRLLSDDSPWS
jgi:hypothetical protein